MSANMRGHLATSKQKKEIHGPGYKRLGLPLPLYALVVFVGVLLSFPCLPVPPVESSGLVCVRRERCAIRHSLCVNAQVDVVGMKNPSRIFLLISFGWGGGRRHAQPLCVKAHGWSIRVGRLVSTISLLIEGTSRPLGRSGAACPPVAPRGPPPMGGGRRAAVPNMHAR